VSDPTFLLERKVAKEIAFLPTCRRTGKLQKDKEVSPVAVRICPSFLTLCHPEASG